jgi:hypothetical protein
MIIALCEEVFDMAKYVVVFPNGTERHLTERMAGDVRTYVETESSENMECTGCEGLEVGQEMRCRVRPHATRRGPGHWQDVIVKRTE